LLFAAVIAACAAGAAWVLLPVWLPAD